MYVCRSPAMASRSKQISGLGRDLPACSLRMLKACTRGLWDTKYEGHLKIDQQAAPQSCFRFPRLHRIPLSP